MFRWIYSSMNDGDERLRADSGDVPLFIVIHRQTVSLPQRTDEHLIRLEQILTTAPGLKTIQKQARNMALSTSTTGGIMGSPSNFSLVKTEWVGWWSMRQIRYLSLPGFSIWRGKRLTLKCACGDDKSLWWRLKKICVSDQKMANSRFPVNNCLSEEADGLRYILILEIRDRSYQI